MDPTANNPVKSGRDTKMPIVGFCGPHRTGKTYLARQTVKALNDAGQAAMLVPSPVSATFKRLGLDPSVELDFNTRLWAQHAIVTAFQDLVNSLTRDPDLDPSTVLVFDRTPFDFSGYMTADYLDGSLTSKQIDKLGHYHSVCMSLMYGGVFRQVYLVHGHEDLPWVHEELKGRKDDHHINILDQVMTQTAFQHSMYTEVLDLPRTLALGSRIDFVMQTIKVKTASNG